MSYCSQSDLEIALGGARVLAQLADFNGDGVADAAVVTDYLESGAAELRSAVEVKHDPEVIAALDAPSLQRLKDSNAYISARVAWEKGGKGQAMPEWTRTRAEREDAYMTALATGHRRLARAAGGKVAAVSQAAGIGTVDFDPDGNGGGVDTSGNKLTRISMTGLSRGFR